MKLSDFKAIISPKPKVPLDELIVAAKHETLKYFGKTVQLYSPLYLSNECLNQCVYCGFNHRAKIKRITLTLEQAVKEAKAISQMGFQHILLLTGEDQRQVPIDYLEKVIIEIKKLFVSVSIEIYPLSEADYRRLVQAGVDGLTLYQESYHRPTYKKVHPLGPKRDFNWRYGGPARGAKAGIRKIGLGFLLGLYDWHYEALKLAEHIQFMLKNYWQTQIQISFPRLNPAETKFKSRYLVSDQDFVRLLCAFRLLFPQIPFTLSTREKGGFRDRIFSFGFTQMSAGSKTNPGGYTLRNRAGRQFEIADPRTPQQICRALIKAGYEPVWKDWDRSLA